jgi:hypothetical protein
VHDGIEPLVVSRCDGLGEGLNGTLVREVARIGLRASTALAKCRGPRLGRIRQQIHRGNRRPGIGQCGCHGLTDLTFASNAGDEDDAA